jgi:hypothetical protein
MRRLVHGIVPLLLLWGLCGCGSSSPTLSSRAAQDLQSKIRVPYRDLHAHVVQNDGAYATVWVQAQVKPGPTAPWRSDTAPYVFSNVGGTWRIFRAGSLQPTLAVENAWEDAHIVLSLARPRWVPGSGTYLDLSLRNPGVLTHSLYWNVDVLLPKPRPRGEPPDIQSADMQTHVPAHGTKHVAVVLSRRHVRIGPGRLFYAIDDRQGYTSGDGVLCDFYFRVPISTWRGDNCPHRYYG